MSQLERANLDEKSSHSLGRVVVTGDGVNHANSVDEAGQGLCHGNRVTAVQRLAELLQGIEVLDIVLRLIRTLCQLVILLTPELLTTSCQHQEQHIGL